MTKQRHTTGWRPHLDLERLSAALADEIVAMPGAELRDVLAEIDYPIAATAQELRELLAGASGEPERVVKLVGSDGQPRIFVAL